MGLRPEFFLCASSLMALKKPLESCLSARSSIPFAWSNHHWFFIRRSSRWHLFLACWYFERVCGVLSQLCTRHGFTITNNLFSDADIYKGNWMHPRSKKWHMIHFIIVSQHFKSNVLDSRVHRTADCWTQVSVCQAETMLSQTKTL